MLKNGAASRRGTSYLRSFGTSSEPSTAEAADAVAREWSIGTVILGGVEYVTDCKCWHAPALKCIEWMDENAYQVAEYLSLEKKRKQDEADRSPLVGVFSSPTIGEDVRHRINP